MGLLRCDTCHNHQTFLVPPGPQEVAKVKLFKGEEGRERGNEVTHDGQSKRIGSVKFRRRKTSVESAAVNASSHVCLSECYVQNRRCVYAR